MLRVIMVLALMLLCAPARADEFEAYEEERLLGCVASAGADEAALLRCIGTGAAPCIEADGSASSSHVLCWSREADTWRALMHRATADLTTRHAARDPQRLAAANAAWEAWAEAECEYWAWEEGGGVGEQVDRVRCHARVTAERAIALTAAAAE